MYSSIDRSSKKLNPNAPRGFGYYLSSILLVLILLVPATVFIIDGVDQILRYDLLSYSWFDAVARISVGTIFVLLTGIVLAAIAKFRIRKYLQLSIIGILWLLANAFVLYGFFMPDVVLETFEDGTKRGLTDGNVAAFYAVLTLLMVVVDILPFLLIKNFKQKTNQTSKKRIV